MQNAIRIVTVVVIYNDEHEFLVARRSSKEEHAPGVMAYPGGGLEFNFKEEEFAVLEKNAAREVKEELNLEIEGFTYLSSHAFTKKNGEQTVVVGFMAKLNGGELNPDQNEVSEVVWMDSIQIAGLKDMYDSVKMVYAQAAERLANTLYHVMLGGLVINENREFLLIRGIENSKLGKFTYPQVPLLFSGNANWEAMEDSLAKGIFTQTGIEIADGCIPFTDQAFVAPDQFDGIVQFFICKYKFEKAQITNPGKVSEISWQKFADFDKQAFLPADYLVFEKVKCSYLI